MTEIQFSIKEHIENKESELQQMTYLWKSILELNDTHGLSNDTFKEVQAKISSRIAQIEISIRDHKKLLS